MDKTREDMTAFRPSPDVLMRKVGDEFVLVHMSRNQIFSLNPTAARLWELLTEGCSRADALAQLTQEFDVPPETAAADADELLRLLKQEGLLETDVP
jgi:hypothetical protein